MNATYLMDHVQAVANVSTMLGATASGATAVNKPKTALTSHYDPQGQSVATVSTTSYEGVTFAADGTIAGGNLSHESSSPDGTKLSTTSVGFQANGKPASAEINIHNIHSDGDFKKVSMDMTAVNWNDSFAISSGQVNVSAFDPSTQAKTHDGTIQFANEALVSGAFTRYATDKANVVDGYSNVDYTKAKFLGAAIVGGQYAVNALNADKSLASTSQVSLSSLGRLQSIETTNLTAANAVKTKVMVDFSKVLFNARNEFDSGDIQYLVNDDKGVKLSETTVTYKNTTPSVSQTLVYNANALQSKIMVDFSQSLFNNHNQVVKSSKKVDVFSADNTLISSSTVAYDQNGVKLANGASATAAALVKPAPVANKLSLPAPFVLKAATAAQTQQRDEKRRADNTLQQVRVTTLEAGKPVSAVITLYGTDGTTVIKTFSMDLSGISYDANAKVVSGTLNMQTHLGGSVLNSVSNVNY